MSNKIYLISVVLVIAWALNYMLWTPPVMIHALLVLAFAGVLTSVLMDENKNNFEKRSSY